MEGKSEMTRLQDENNRFYDLPHGVVAELERRLVKGRLTADLVDLLLGRQDVVDGMLGWAREQLAPPAACGRVFDGKNLVGWYGTPRDQLTNMRRWNKARGWGFDKADFPEAPAEFMPIHEFEVLVLVAYLSDKVQGGRLVPGYVRTYNEYMHIIKGEQPSLGVMDFEKSADELRLLEGTEERHELGIRWMVVNLGANPNTPPAKLDCANLAHAELLAAFAQMPAYVQAMNWFANHSRLWAAGYQATTQFGGEAWSQVPNLWCSESGERKTAFMHTERAVDPSRDTFAPTARQL